MDNDNQLGLSDQLSSPISIPIPKRYYDNYISAINFNWRDKRFIDIRIELSLIH
jgi:hypothetical protein